MWHVTFQGFLLLLLIPTVGFCLPEGPRCSCDPLECDDTYKPLCGRNGRTYANDCLRRKAECEMKTLISIRSQGPCGEWSLFPGLPLELAARCPSPCL
uniref:Kazal-like domain-containing protein n=1 Tax=Oryzias sinensis TaxID=183150 RepID=A0A8C7YDA0_9TELE